MQQMKDKKLEVNKPTGEEFDDLTIQNDSLTNKVVVLPQQKRL